MPCIANEPIRSIVACSSAARLSFSDPDAWSFKIDTALAAMRRSLLFAGSTLFRVIWVTCLVAGCRSIPAERACSEPVFFPSPPEIPRLQFLTSFCGPDDLGARQMGGLERFVIGQPEPAEDLIAPYGMALYEDKLYVCDVGRRTVVVFDLLNRTLYHLTGDRRLIRPVNIFIDDSGRKYVADPTAGLVFVFDPFDNLISMLGKRSKISPVDVVTRGELCYVTDCAANQIVVLNKVTGQEIIRIGRKRQIAGRVGPEAELPPGDFSLISDLDLDQQSNIFVTDKAGARITQFDRSGLFRRTIGRLGDNVAEFVRPKGIAIDRENRIWIVDAATEVAKIYDAQGRLLLFFGLPGNKPGMMNLPAAIVIDYNHVHLFQEYAVPGAAIEFLVLVSNQYGPNKISVYGFGTFPVLGEAMSAKSKHDVGNSLDVVQGMEVLPSAIGGSGRT